MTYTFLIALAVVFLFPFVIAIVTSFKTDPNATAYPLSLRPSPATGAAYHDLFPHPGLPQLAQELGDRDALRHLRARLPRQPGGLFPRAAALPWARRRLRDGRGRNGVPGVVL
jgi:hypothetical protein